METLTAKLETKKDWKTRYWRGLKVECKQEEERILIRYDGKVYFESIEGESIPRCNDCGHGAYFKPGEVATEQGKEIRDVPYCPRC